MQQVQPDGEAGTPVEHQRGGGGEGRQGGRQLRAGGGAVQAQLALRYGTEKSLFGQDVVSRMAGSLLDKGGAGLTRQQVADQFDKLKAQVGFSGSGDAVFVNITTKRDNLPAVIELVGRLLREPAFEAGPLEEARRQWLAAVERQRCALAFQSR